MKAILKRHIKHFLDEISFIEIKIWSVPKSDDKPHGFKYSLVYIVNGKRIIGYDNGEHKGDHKHIIGVQHKYDFISVEKLIDDFKNDVEEVRK